MARLWAVFLSARRGWSGSGRNKCIHLKEQGPPFFIYFAEEMLLLAKRGCDVGEEGFKK